MSAEKSLTRARVAEPLAIDICVCTFRRPHIAETLRSIARHAPGPGLAIRVIVADNDDTPSAMSLVETTGRECRLNVRYVHAPARNISVARNACLDLATAPLVLFVDDDEEVTASWPHALINEIVQTGADVVLGPVQAVYSPDCPLWMREGDFHSPKPVWVDGGVTNGYSCNVVFRRESAAFSGLRFRPDLGRSGGEDAFFFAQARRAGARFGFAPAGVVTEDVAPERAQVSWLLKRYFRSGQTHGRWLLHDGGSKPLARVGHAVLAGAKALICLAAASFSLLRTKRLVFWVLRGVLHLGVVSRLLGHRELEQYGQPG